MVRGMEVDSGSQGDRDICLLSSLTTNFIVEAFLA